MIDFTPNPIAIRLGPVDVYWYGIGYALGIAAAAWLITREARRRGLNTDLIPNGLIVIAVAALIGGRAYHVIDQWHLYKDDLIRIVLPPYTGLGIYGGVVLGLVAFYAYTRYYRQSFWVWADVAAPAVLLTQAIARWGNFFNQELYGPPTSLPWGIAIQCQYRVAEWQCPPLGTTPANAHFIPLFLYESLLSLLGVAVMIWASRRLVARLRVGDLALLYFVWYGVERFLLEFFRSGYNWTFFGMPTAQVVASLFVVGAVAVFVIRHSRPRRPDDSIAPPAPGEPAASTAIAEAVRAGDARPADAPPRPTPDPGA